MLLQPAAVDPPTSASAFKDVLTGSDVMQNLLKYLQWHDALIALPSNRAWASSTVQECLFILLINSSPLFLLPQNISTATINAFAQRARGEDGQEGWVRVVLL